MYGLRQRQEVGGRVEDISCFTGSDQDRHKKEKETTNEYYVIHLAVQEASAPVILSEILILFILQKQEAGIGPI